MADRTPWNWEQNDWPHFRFDSARLEPLEHRFLRMAGEFAGTIKQVTAVHEAIMGVRFL